MGQHPDHEASLGRTNRRGHFRGVAGSLIAVAAAASGLPLGLAGAEAPAAPSLQEFIDSSPIVNQLVGLDETEAPRTCRLRVHPSAPLSLDFNPAISAEMQQAFANSAASSSRKNEISATDFVLTSAETTPPGVSMEPVVYPFKGVRTVLGFIGSGRLSDVATLFFAPTTNAEQLYQDEGLRTDGVYRYLESAYAKAIATGGTDNGQGNSEWDVLRQAAKGLFMITPKAKNLTESPEEPVKEVLDQAELIDQTGRFIIKDLLGTRYSIKIAPEAREALAWFTTKQLQNSEFAGDYNLVQVVKPKLVPSVPLSTTWINSRLAGLPGLEQPQLSTGTKVTNNRNYFWAGPEYPGNMFWDNELYMTGIYGAINYGMLAAVFDGRSTAAKLGSKRTELNNFLAAYPKPLIISEK